MVSICVHFFIGLLPHLSSQVLVNESCVQVWIRAFRKIRWRSSLGQVSKATAVLRVWSRWPAWLLENHELKREEVGHAIEAEYEAVDLHLGHLGIPTCQCILHASKLADRRYRLSDHRYVVWSFSTTEKWCNYGASAHKPRDTRDGRHGTYNRLASFPVAVWIASLVDAACVEMTR